jgi:hypothetical protein
MFIVLRQMAGGLCRPTARYRRRFSKILAFRRRPVNFAVAKRLRGLGMFSPENKE